MNDEFAARRRAITLRLAGRSAKQVCSALGRTEAWFHKCKRNTDHTSPKTGSPHPCDNTFFGSNHRAIGPPMVHLASVRR